MILIMKKELKNEIDIIIRSVYIDNDVVDCNILDKLLDDIEQKIDTVYYDTNTHISILWSIDDVQSKYDELRDGELTDDQAMGGIKIYSK